MIAAARRTLAKISSIVFCPITMLANSVVMTNKRVIRWAIRRRAGWAYLSAIFWFPVLTVAGLTWALVSIHEKPDKLSPTVGVVAILAKKFLAIVWYLVQQAERVFKALRYYRRRFS